MICLLRAITIMKTILNTHRWSLKLPTLLIGVILEILPISSFMMIYSFYKLSIAHCFLNDLILSSINILAFVFIDFIYVITNTTIACHAINVIRLFADEDLIHLFQGFSRIVRVFLIFEFKFIRYCWN
jgi:hypothetical protein